MPINNIPGVGPTNADIATAVAAPSAATIAAAVAAPSAATIASTVAASVPTLTQINTSVATNAPSPNGWTVVSSITPNGSASSYTWSSLSGYKTYRIIWSAVHGTNTTPYGLRFNSDTAGNYLFSYTGLFANNNSSTFGANASYIALGSDLDHDVWNFGDVTIEQATVAANASVKGSVYGRSSGSTFNLPSIAGQWRNTANVTSITFYTVSNRLITGGNITLLGAN